MKIFIGFNEIAGYYTRLYDGLLANGHVVTYAGGESHLFAYKPALKFNFLVRWFGYAQSRRARTKHNYIVKLFWILCQIIASLFLFLWAIFTQDVFIFGYGASFLPLNVDLPILKFLRKRVICMITFGSDARPCYINGAFLDNEGKFLSTKKCARLVKNQKRMIRRTEKNASVVVAAPLTAQLLEHKFVSWFALGIPVRRSENHTLKYTDQKVVRILHSPSRLLAKGTPKIRQAIANLKEKGHQINFVEITGQPNHVVLAELAQCDFVVDQLYSDTPMAVFASEAAMYEKPAVVGGYGWQQLKALLSEDQFPPSEICHPDDIEAAIEKLIVDKNYRVALGQKACRFINKNWSPADVAQRFIALAHDEIPQDWWLDPQSIIYVQGAGLSEDSARQNIRAIVAEKGDEALQLKDKPLLKAAFLAFASA